MDVGKRLVMMLPHLHASQTGPCGPDRVRRTITREKAVLRPLSDIHL